MDPLAGLSVVEIAGGPAAGFCGRQFQNWGASVTVLETGLAPEPGEAFRRIGKSTAALSELEARLARTDVLIVEGSAPNVSVSALRATRPALVVVEITDFGLGGRRAARGELEARTGYLWLNGRRGGPPMAAPANLIAHALGASAFVGGMAALIRRTRTGLGDHVEARGLDTVAGFVPYLRDQQRGGPSPRQSGTPEGARLIRCADGWISVAPAIAAHLEVYRAILGATEDEVPDSLIEPGLGTSADRVAAALAPFAARMPVDAVMLGLQTAGVVCGIVQHPSRVLADPQLAARGFFKAPGVAGRSAQFAPGPAADPAPPVELAPDAPPLTGLTILDLTQAWIGPLAGQVLADLGAKVVKVEGPVRPDIWRWMGQSEAGDDDPLNRSCYFNSANRGKDGLALDLGRPEGAAAFLRLAAQAEVVIENFTPRVMARFGLDYPRLAAINPGLVMASFSGFGADGPHAAFKANGSSIEAFAGWDALHCDASGDPVLMATYPADPMCGLLMAGGVLAALHGRLVHGRGGHVEGSMLEGSAELIGDVLLTESNGESWTDPPVAIAGDAAKGWRLDTASAAVPICDPIAALNDPEVAASLVTLDTPGQGVALHAGPFHRFERASRAPLRAPPRLGADTLRVLSDFGFDADEITDLVKSGVVAVNSR
ncbi:CoA transferase [Phenylobacterium sp.]|jgi:crotonobetainyl-CoA:carnitine CoA-transferase CaiB-like acyl-CoA transferase|uniref:CaiB/BaiF CoA-transferase family protein n=1 Tax=Phenylobacterium sp. TaxID=1871053 RepID=UPI0037CBDA4D